MSGNDRSQTTVARTLMMLFALIALFHQPLSTSAQTGSSGRTVIAVTAANQLVRFNSATPATLSASVAITGLQAGESILGIDIRPTTGELFALGSTSRLYLLNANTGAATQVGTGTFAVPLSGAEFGFDFNPTVDRIRVVSDTGQNLRLNPITGAVVDGDAVTGGVQPDGALNGAATGAVASGYINSLPGAQTTLLYNIDAAGDQLVTQVPPNNGTTAAVGPLGVDVTGAAGFDIIGAGNESYAALTLAGEPTARWYSINLASGAATEVGAIGVAVRAVAIVPPPPDVIYALTASNTVISFSSSAPGTILDSLTLSGLQSGEALLGIDFRPVDGRLYALSDAGRIYTIDTFSGAATLVGSGPLSPAISGTAFGFDFNPAADRIRIVSDAEQNLRVNPTTAVPLVDTSLAYAVGDINAGANPNIAAAGYTNNISGTTSTALFVIDTSLDVLALQNPPNNGALGTIGPLGVDVTDQLGFDISRDGAAYVSFTAPAGTSSSFGTINTATGTIASLGTIGGGVVIRDLAVPTWQKTLFLSVVSR